MALNIVTIIVLVILAVAILTLTLKFFTGLLQLAVPVLLVIFFAGIFVNIAREEFVLSPTGWAFFDVREKIKDAEPIIGRVNSTVKNITEIIGEVGKIEVATGPENS
ncbi:hypothetical protein HY483_01585 [Candidatus Woesearchaeota archaeon]|nr:hypothetical protein [Candidatus Woesearchaeota archaeon]